MTLHYLQHVPFEGLGSIAEWAQARGVETQGYAAYENEFPTLNKDDCLVILGGPMGVNDGADYAWIAAEKAFLQRCRASGVNMLGICLGAQFLADLLGAKVYQGPQREIGWFPLTLTDDAVSSPLQGFPKYFPVIHWHGETFDLPTETTRLASSDVYPNQAFQSHDKRIVGLQFHLELMPEQVLALATACADELTPGQPYVQTEAMMLADPGRFASIRQQAWQLMDNWYETT